MNTYKPLKLVHSSKQFICTLYMDFKFVSMIYKNTHNNIKSNQIEWSIIKSDVIESNQIQPYNLLFIQ